MGGEIYQSPMQYAVNLAHAPQRGIEKLPPSQVNPPKNPSSCVIYKPMSHTPSSCPRAFYERCGKLGHLAALTFCLGNELLQCVLFNLGGGILIYS